MGVTSIRATQPGRWAYRSHHSLLTDRRRAMVGWIVLVVGVAVMIVLTWWSSKGPDNGPGDELARKFRNSGGPMGM